MKINSPLELIGNTPLLNISSFFPNAAQYNIDIWIKLERFNLGGSIKDRTALNMIDKALQEGIINQQTHIIEPTSGNTGIALAMIGAIKKLKVTIVMPESMSRERKNLIMAYGANLICTPAHQGIQGAISKAQQLTGQEKNCWMPNQFENPNNPLAHKQTAEEIIQDLAQLDYLITGIGTGGHISGCGQYLKSRFPSLTIYGVEPQNSAVINQEDPGEHNIQGIGAGFIPKTLNRKLLTQTITVSDQDASMMAKKFTQTFGVLVGTSTGASLQAIQQQLSTFRANSTVITFNPDTGERYLF